MAHQFYSVDITDSVSGPGIKERIPVKTIVFTNQDIATDLTGVSLSGYTLATGDRFVLGGQTTSSENGIYICETPTPYRSSDYYSGDNTHAFFTVSAGTYANTEWQATGNGLVDTGSQGFIMKNMLSYAAGDIIYAETNKTLTTLSKPPNTSFLQMNNDGIADWVETIGVANGGTGAATLTAGNLLVGNGTSAVNFLAPTSYKVLTTNNTPAFSLSNDVHLSSIQGSTTTQYIITFTDVVSATAYLAITNGTAAPTITATGSGTDVNLNLAAKGAGTFNLTSATNAQLNIYNNTNYVALKSPTLGSNLVFTLPSADGSSGQTLRTNGSGVLSFGSAGIDLTLAVDPIIVSSFTATAFSTMCYQTAAYGSGVSATLYLEVSFGSNFDFIVYNVTASSAISTTSYTTGGFKTITFTTPTSNSRIEFRVRRTAGGAQSRLYGVQMTI